jgi:hypothetical protein
MIQQTDMFGGSHRATEPTGHQCRAVLEHMRRYGSVTDLDAYSKLGIRRLAARVNDLRNLGWDITTYTEKHDGGTHARYVLRQHVRGQHGAA